MERSARSIFDEAAASWDEKPGRVRMARRVAQAIREQAPLSKEMRAMEYGCGTGLVSVALSQKLKEILAVDTSGKMLEMLEQKLEQQGIRNISTLQADLSTPTQELLDGIGKFHLIFTSMTLHHIEDAAGLIETFSTLLLPGGWLAIADLDREDGSFHNREIEVPHHGFHRSWIMETMQRCGLDRTTAATAYEMEKEIREGEMRRYPVFLAAGQKPLNRKEKG